MEKSNANPNRRILFLLSLPSTQEFEQDKEAVEECLTELIQLNVDVRNHILPEDLAESPSFDIVVVVAHHDISSDALMLEDNTFPMDEFLKAIPSDFNGVIDLAFCNSALYLNSVKQKCPDATVQVALNNVPLLRRVIIYPYLIEMLRNNPDIDYNTAYARASDEFNRILGDISEDDPSDIYMNLLGKRMTSLYAPSQIVKNQTFWIYLFFYYDSDTQTINLMVNDWMAKKIKLEHHEIFFPLKRNADIFANLNFKSRFQDQILLLNGTSIRHFRITDNVAVEPFLLKVLPDFKDTSILTEIKVSNDGFQFLTFSFTINIGDKFLKEPTQVNLDKMIKPDDELQILQAYRRFSNSKLFGNASDPGFGQYELNTILKLNNHELHSKLMKVRRFVFNNSMFFDYLHKILKNCENSNVRLGVHIIL